MYLDTLILITGNTAVSMATSSKTSVHPTSPKQRGWLSAGKKLQIIPSKSLIPSSEEEEVYSSGPVKKMKQVKKSRSEKGKMKIYESSQDLDLGNTKWHVSLPNVHNTQQESVSRDISGSPKRNPLRTSPLPPPPSNPPPILNRDSDTGGISKGRGLVKSVSAGAINIVSHTRTPGRPVTPQGAVVTTNGMERKAATVTNGKQRKVPPPKIPPPYTTKARAVTVVSAAMQDHMQSSTRSAPGGIQKHDERESKLTVSERNIGTRVRSESAETAMVADASTEDDATSQNIPNSAPATTESPLTASMEGGVKSLARYFSARSKEGVVASPKDGNKLLREVKGRRQIFKNAIQKASSIPETGKEESEVSTPPEERFNRLPPIHSISEESDGKYEVLQNVGSMVSSGSPTHMSIFSWYNVDSNSKFESNVSKRRYQNVFDDEAFACFDKTGFAKKESQSSTSPKSPYKEYQNILVETATLERTTSDVPSPKEGSHKEKKPIPLPRTQSKERGIGMMKNKARPLATSNSEGSLAISTPHSAITRCSSEYVDMARELGYSDGTVVKQVLNNSQEVGQPPESPGIVVMGSLDPEWREKYEELIEKEIEMLEGFSDYEEHLENSEECEILADMSTAQPMAVPGVVPLPFNPLKKSALKKTQSHNPTEPSIHRRNTPKEKRELRKGVCSDSDQLEPNEEAEIDDYIDMKSAQQPEALNNTPLPSQGTPKERSEITSSPTVPTAMGPHSSTYYLKILPSQPAIPKPAMVRLAEESATAVSPTTPIKHYYIEIDIPDEASEESEPKLVQRGTSNAPTLPPKSSPTHTTGRVLERPANGKRKLKYPKIDVAPATDEDNKNRNAKSAGKLPYSRVKVDSDTVPNAVDGSSKNDTMNYVDRPLPPTPSSENAIYYKTVNHPLHHIPALRRVWHHEYIEIDENELNKKSEAQLSKPPEGWINIHAVGGPVRVHDTKKRSLTTLPPPPPIPQRPSCPYVEIDGEELEDMVTSLPPKPKDGLHTSHAAMKGRLGVSMGPKTARVLGPPPAIPGRPEHSSRQRSFSSSGEYAYPVIPGLKFEWMNLQKDGGYFTPRVPLPSHHHNAKHTMMNTITERGEDQPPRPPPKTESLLREQQALLANKHSGRPSPYLVPVTSSKQRKFSSPAIFDLSVSSAVPPPEHTRLKSPSELIRNMRKELLGEEKIEDEDTSVLPSHLKLKKKAMHPPRQPLPYSASAEAKENSNSQPPKLPQKQRKASREDGNGVSIADSPDGVMATLPPDMLMARKAGLQHKLDRNSLAMIMRNKSAIAEQLEKESDSPKSQWKQISPSEDAIEFRHEGSVVRSLGDILLDVDALLQHHMCSEDDVIAAIEKQLNIKLVKKTESDREEREDKSNGTLLEDSVRVTEQDVKDVVTFMNKRQNSPTTTPKESGSEIRAAAGEEEEGVDDRVASVIINRQDSSEQDSFTSPKHRSSTFVVVDDTQSEETVKMHFPEDETERPNIYDRRVPSPIREGDEDADLGEKSMRDSRSCSVGLKPLRRVKARRKTNPASDMANLSSGK